jgi:peroxiredoxin
MKKLALLVLLFGVGLLFSPVSGAVALGQVVTQQQVITQEKGQASTEQKPQIIPGNVGPKRDPKFNVEVAQPAFTNRHPKILFDEAHLNQGLSNRYADLIALLKNDGCSVTVNKQPFAPGVLSGYDGLIIINAVGSRGNDMYEKPAFTEAECDSVSDWVHAGGALLLISRGSPSGGANTPLATRFGVGMSNGRTISDPDNRDMEQVTNNIPFTVDRKLLSETHSIMRGRNQEERITRIIGYGGQSLNVSQGGEVLIRFPSTAMETPSTTAAEFRDAIAKAKSKDPDNKMTRLEVPGKKEVPVGGRAEAVALLLGKGRVVVIGDDRIFAAELLGGQMARIVGKEMPIGMNTPGYDNRQLALNVMRWLTGVLDPPKATVVGGTGLMSSFGPYKKWDAPPFSVTTLDGKEFNLGSLRGKVVVLNFWFIGCKPCVAEIPDLNKLVADYGADKDVIFLSLAQDDAASLREFLKKHDFAYNVAAAASDIMSYKYQIAAFPTNMIVDRQGKVVFESTGGVVVISPNGATLDGPSPKIMELRAELQRALKGDSN